MRLYFGHVWWGLEYTRKKGINLIGTIPAFGWAWCVGHKSLGIQISLGVWHCYALLQFSFWRHG